MGGWEGGGWAGGWEGGGWVVAVTGSSLTLSVALLVCPSGTAHSIVDCHEFTGPEK